MLHADNTDIKKSKKKGCSETSVKMFQITLVKSVIF